jgi:hypothetical protein
MASTMVHAPNLAEAGVEAEEFFERSRAADVFFPHLAGYTVIDRREREFFFEFLAPSDIKGQSVAFRVWKSQFLVPTVGWLLGDADRSGSITFGRMPKAIDASAISLFLESFWWENHGGGGGMGVVRAQREGTMRSDGICGPSNWTGEPVKLLEQ